MGRLRRRMTGRATYGACTRRITRGRPINTGASEGQAIACPRGEGALCGRGRGGNGRVAVREMTTIAIKASRNAEISQTYEGTRVRITA